VAELFKMADTRDPSSTPIPAEVVAAPDARRGLILGIVAVAIFAIGVPMTRLATGTVEAPQLSGAFVAFGRAVVGGVLGAIYLVATGARWPDRAHHRSLLIVAGGMVVAFPLAMSIALRYVESIHVSAMLGVGPLLTAVAAARLDHQPQRLPFWIAAAVGTLLVGAYPVVKAGASLGDVGGADLLLIGALMIAAFATIHGARLARVMPAAQVTAWTCAGALPFTITLAGLTWPVAPADVSAWAGVVGVGVGTVWAGSLLWYRALAIGGTVRVSQLVLIQPLMGMVFAVPLLGESIDAITAGFGIAIVATVFVGRRFASRG
jgi:drug/metabolite transporter (DMT)-like permease